MITIERAKPEDFLKVIELVQELLIELGDNSMKFDGLDIEKVQREMQQNKQSFNALVAKNESGRLIGVSTVIETYAIYAGGNYGVIAEMYISPEYRSQGIGRRLIDAVKALATEKNWARVDVTAPPDEKWAKTVKFYEGNGFHFTGPKLKFKLNEMF